MVIVFCFGAEHAVFGEGNLPILDLVRFLCKDESGKFPNIFVQRLQESAWVDSRVDFLCRWALARSTGSRVDLGLKLIRVVFKLINAL
ncbi:hypothetical protein TIFTF001_029369 [Ficus carica]|uniref:Uncharacterized protein n=1 Tax=Ficus carica TaxID=3494 RepID=A0AA88IXX8_FICCA|nr:hypothetical protein TIFTF001_029369 [Ficus carica]